MLTFADLKKTPKLHEMSANGVLTIDPGLKNTGWALWYDMNRLQDVGGVPPPSFSGVHKTRAPHWTHNVDAQARWLGNFLVERRCGLVVIEWVEMWSSARSEATAKKGGLFQLAALVGAMLTEAWGQTYSEPVLVLAREWKGQLKNAALKRRVRRVLKKDYPDHEADAVGIGLAIQGAL